MRPICFNERGLWARFCRDRAEGRLWLSSGIARAPRVTWKKSRLFIPAEFCV
jgi:hypothetical protein